MIDWGLFLAQATGPSPLGQQIDNLARTPLSKVVIFMAVCTLIRFALYPRLNSTPVHLRDGVYKFLRFLNETLDALVYAAGIVFLIIRPFGIQTFYIPTGSMLETLQLNDYIVANKWVYRTQEPNAGDIVVFRPPATALRPEDKQQDYIKRLIGTPGQVIEIRDGLLYRDGKRVEEPYVTRDRGIADTDFKLVKEGDNYMPVQMSMGMANSDPYRIAQAFLVDPSDFERQKQLMDAPPAAVPEGYYLMMGDNRNNSADGRFWGLVPRRNLIGRSEVIFVPVNRMRVTR